MDKTRIRDLEGYMAIPEVTKVLGLTRARVHQLVEEGKFDLEDLRVVGDKRMIIIRVSAVYTYMHMQEDRVEAALIRRQEEKAKADAKAKRAAIIAEARASKLEAAKTLAVSGVAGHVSSGV